MRHESEQGHDAWQTAPRRSGRALRRVRVAALTAAAVVGLAGCGVLGLDEAGPAQATVTTSAATVAADAATQGGAAVTVPTYQSGQTEAAPTPTPWVSLTTTAAPTTMTGPAVTRPTIDPTVKFITPTAATNPTIAAPTAVKMPAPDCYLKKTCGTVASAQAAGGTVHIVVPSGGLAVAVLQPPSGEATSVSLPGVNNPSVTCSGSYCLVQGSTYGLNFGNLILSKGGVLRPVTGTVSSLSKLSLLPTSPPVIAGSYRFDSYGVTLNDSPTAARTWSIIGGKLASTGCGEPYLYRTPPAATARLGGPCSGTPRIHGWGPSSGNTLTSLSGFVTPSGNIQCALLPNNRLVCGAKNSAIKVSVCKQPVTAIPVALRGLRVTMGNGGVVAKDDCIGYDLVGMPTTRIGYNRLAVARGFVCEVREDGVTCTAPTGHGFSLNRSSLSTF